MGFQFAETMEGTVEWDAQPGFPRPFSFEVTASAASTRRYLQDGQAQLRGLVHAPPLCDAGPAEGIITIRPLDQRIIRYELQFTGDDDRTYELLGQKDIRWTAPLRSFTQLPAEIFDDEHRRVGTCRIAFNTARDGWRFLRSFRRV